MTRRPWNTERMGPRTDVNVRHLQKAKRDVMSHIQQPNAGMQLN